MLLAFVAALFGACQNQPKTTTEPANDYVHFANKTDYICGMDVSTAYADTCHYKGKAYAFCSVNCKEAFKENPEQYLAEEK